MSNSSNGSMDHAISSLRSGPETLRALVVDLAPEEIRWRPEPGKWSMVEVIGHLLDEEREDFRPRLELTLDAPGSPWPGIDPPARVLERAHQNRDPEGLLEDFVEERARSLAWLDGRGRVALEASHEHPALGTLRAGDLLCSWAAHDLLHFRQLLGLRFARLGQMSCPYRSDYAGLW